VPIGSSQKQTDISLMSNEAKIYHIRQKHPIKGGTASVPDKEEICESQYKIAKFFWNRASAIVFVEGLTEDLEEKNRKSYLEQNPKLNIYLETFSNGLPSRYEDLNEDQKFLLENNMAAPLLWVLGRLNNVYATGSGSEQRSLYDRGVVLLGECDLNSVAHIDCGKSKEIYEVILKKREELALARVEAFLAKQSATPEEIFIIFGSLHDFGASIKIASGF